MAANEYDDENDYDYDTHEQMLTRGDDRSWIETIGPEWVEASVYRRWGVTIPTGVVIETTRHNHTIDWLADRFSGPSRIGRGIGIALGIAFFAMLVATAGLVLTSGPSPASNPVNALVIPGVNDFIPLSTTPYVIAGLLVTLTVHELAHGIAARRSDWPVVSTGVGIWLVFPFGYVNLLDDWETQLSPRARLNVAFAGILANVWVGISLVPLGMLYNAIVDGAWIVGTPSAYQFVDPVAGVLVATAFLNLGVGTTQLIPLKWMDGAHALRAVGEAVAARLERPDPPSTAATVGRAGHWASVAVLATIYVAPWVLEWWGVR